MQRPGESRLAGILSAMSLATDLAMGLPPAHAIRACLVATRFASRITSDSALRSGVYYTSLLRYVGCTAFAHEEAALAGDDVAARSAGAATDFTRPREAISFMLSLTVGAPRSVRLRALVGGIIGGRAFDAALKSANCEVAAHTAERLGLGQGVSGPLYQIFERWDGKGVPDGRRGDAVEFASRVANVAHCALLANEMGGPELVDLVLRDRAGSWLDPELCHMFATSRDVWPGPADDEWRDVLAEEPGIQRMLSAGDLPVVAAAFGDLADLKTPVLHGHARSVAEIAVAGAVEMGLPDAERDVIECAALLHDVGRVAVASSTWEKPGPLTALEWDQVRMHPQHTERILSRASILAETATIAAAHHERPDGNGYHRALPAGMQPPAARLLAAADVLAALQADRPYRPAFTSDAAADELERAVGAGAVDTEAAEAVLAGQGVAMRRRARHWPGGLSDREVEVIRLLAAGRSKREIARDLFISSSTAHTHVVHIYDKIGTTTRAGAALFAMEHGLYLAHPPEKSTVRSMGVAVLDA